MDISTSPLVSVFMMISHSFRLELFFLLAGFFSHMKYHREGIARFLQSRTIQIVIPLIVSWFLLRSLLISGWIMGHFDQVQGLHGWQWLFLLEAIPSVLLGILTFWALPNHFQQAKWLSADDKAQLAADLAADDAEGKDSKHSFRDGFFNLKVWMLGGIDFSILLSAYAMGFWMPTFIRNTGVMDTFHIGLLTAIPSLAALAGMLAGAATVILWKQTGSAMYEIVPGFIAATLAIVVASLLDKPPPHQVQVTHQQVRASLRENPH